MNIKGTKSEGKRVGEVQLFKTKTTKPMKVKFCLVFLLIAFFFSTYAQQIELLQNGDFSNGTNGWWYMGATASASNGEVTFNITNPGTNLWDVQLGQGGLTLKKGYKYTLSWRAKRQSGTIAFLVQLDHDPYTFIFGKTESEDGNWKESSVVFEQTGSNVSGVGVTIQLGGNASQAVFDYISLKEEPIEPVAQGPELLTNADFSDGVAGWWVSGANTTGNNGELSISITNPGTNSWDVQLSQGSFILRKGYKYTLSWRAKRESGSLEFGVGLGSAPYTSYMTHKSVGFSGNWEELSMSYNHTTDDVSNIIVSVNMGGSTAKATFDYIHLTEELIENNGDTPSDAFIGQSYTHPGNLELDKVPQFVCLSFDDNLYPDGVEWLCKQVEGLKNPDGLNVGLTFFYNSTQFKTSTASVQTVNKYLAGVNSSNEIGNHSYDHPHDVANRTVLEWKSIIQKGMDSLAHYTNVTEEDLLNSGFRAPYLEYDSNLYEALLELGVRYDHSAFDYYSDTNEAGWPYMFKSESATDNKKYLWKVPIRELYVPETSALLSQYGIASNIKTILGGNTIGAEDYNLWEIKKLDAATVLGLLKYNFDISLASNKAPFTFCLHSHYYSEEATSWINPNCVTTLAQRQNAIKEYIAYCRTKENVYLTTLGQMLNWMENPITPEIALRNPGIGPVSYYGQMQAHGNRIYGSRTQAPMQVKGMSFYWSLWGGEEFWNTEAVNALVDDWKVEMIRVPMAVEFNEGQTENFGYLDPRGRDRQIKLVETLVDAAIAKGIYVLIDYHSHDADTHTQNAKEFFGYMAKKYGGYDNVIFEIYNEPKVAKWATIKTYAEDVIDTIRIYSDNMVTVGTEFFSLRPDISSLSPINDPNVSYVFHFYGRNMETFGSYVTTALNNNIALLATEWGNIYMDEGDKLSRTDAASFANADAYHKLMDANMISSANWCVLATNMEDDAPNEACLFNEEYGPISRTGENWNDTILMTPSGKYVYKWLQNQAKVVPWRKAVHLTPPKHFTKGVNITDWFHNVPDIGRVQLTKYDEQDLIDIKSLGCDVIRLLINMKGMTSGAPNYTFDPRYFYILDQIVDMAEEVGINLILDNHYNSATPANVDQELIPMWKQMAAHFKDRSTGIYYEIMNEPHEISEPDWNVIQKKVLAEIRKIDQKHTVIVTCSNYSSYNNFSQMPVYDDANLIYTFHFYDPFLFTHQGTSYVTSTLTPLSGVPFPYSASRMPALPDASHGDWIETAYENYPVEGTVESIRKLIDKAADFSASRNVEVFCGEFGTNMNNTPAADRNYWHEAVSSYMLQKNISWTQFEYRMEFPPGGFGLFNPASDELFTHNMNASLAKALGFTPPIQSEYVIQPEKTGLLIYADYISHGIVENSAHSSGTLDFCSESNPNNGKFCIYWSGDEQYSRIGFDFKPNKDLSQLQKQNYQLGLYVKGDTPGTTFDIRFVDSDTDDPNDHPWPMKYTIDDSKVSWDGNWHYVKIPLQSFTEAGTYDNGWFEPIGAFDWHDIDQVEFSLQNNDIKGKKLWFDQIEIIAPEVIYYTVSATVSPTNSGTLTGTGSYENGKTATLTATPSSGYEFVNWTNGGNEVSTNASYSFKVNGNVSLTANFELIPPATYSVQATANPADGGTVTGSGTYEEGASVTLTATPNAGYDFVDWTKEGEEVSANSSYSFTLIEDLSLVANFKKKTGVSVIESRKIQIYPNPTDGMITVKGLPENEKVSVCVYGMDGKRLIRIDTEEATETKFDISELPKGIYQVVIVSNNFMGIRNVVRN